MAYVPLQTSINALPNSGANTFVARLAIATTGSTLTNNRWLNIIIGDADATITITSTGINNTAIGSTTASTGAFTNASASQYFATASGSTGAPGYTFSSALTTGIYYSAGIQFTVANSNVGAITATGLNGMAVGATTANTGAFTTISTSSTSALTGEVAVNGSISGSGDRILGVYGSYGPSLASTVSPLLISVTLTNNYSGSGYLYAANIQSTLTKSGNSVLVGAGLRVGTPNVGGSGTITKAACIYVETAPSGGTNNYSIYSAGGYCTFVGGLDNTPIGGGTANSGSFTTLSTSSTSALTGNVGVGGTVRTDAALNITSSINTTSGAGYFQILNGTINATANSDIVAFQRSAGTFNTATFTLLGYIGSYISAPTLTGSGSLATATMIQIGSAPTATTTYGIHQTGADQNVFGGLIQAASIQNTPIGSVTPSTGAFTTITASGAITPSQTAGIVGTTTNNNANAGSIGEYIESVIPYASAVHPVTGAAINVTSVSLTAGDWMVTGMIMFDFSTGGATALANAFGWASSTSATLPNLDLALRASFLWNNTTVPVGTQATPLPTIRFSLASTTTVYLSAFANVTTAGTNYAWGAIRAWRIR